MTTRHSYLPTCDPNLRPIVSSQSHPFTSRRAVDSSGLLGSFYDACCDRVLQCSNLNFTTQSARSQRPPECSIDKCDSDKSWNLLEWHNMHHELRLSVALQMVREMGVGALINYSHPINKYTRFICCTYHSSTDYISDDEFKALDRNKVRMPDTLPTHVIVMVNWGIDAVAVLQLPHDDASIDEIDHAIKKLCISLSSNQTNVVLSENDKDFLKKIVYTDVFSNIPDVSKTKSIIEFHREISRVKNNNNLLKPYNYSLCSVQSFYSSNNNRQGIYAALPEEDIISIELDLLPLLRNFEKLRTAMEQRYSNLQQHLKYQLSEMRTKWSNLNDMYMEKIQKLRDLVIGIRRGEIEYKRIHEALNADKNKQLTKSIDNFEYDLKIMQEKDRVIGDLLEKHFEYQDASEYGVKNGDDEQTIELKLLNDDKHDCVICFNDILRNKNKSEWDQLVTQSINQRKENRQLRFIFVDFSYSPRELDRFIILSTIEKKNNDTTPKPLAVRSQPERPKNDGAINILLLGESGVGKSTFINALANYLTFNTLEQAQRKPMVLIPVYFVMTVDDDFKEHQVKFSRKDNLYNEDYEHIGQSVTQHCKSYVFTLPDSDSRERKLRIIDTPGIGDVRGVAQDDINMQHILSYMTNLTHLNAVCILMKPNNSRLNIFFRSCFKQLFDLLGENAGDKIIFCFTNSRATFYTPGNTGPLVKNLLESLLIKNVSFTKQNTFCFDSESFRYLVARRNNIEFSPSEEKDYKDSWEKSSSESKRFLEYIRTKMTSPLFPGEFESMKDAQLKITVLIRPILESMRNILRNIVLWNTGSRTISIELRPRTITDPAGICLTCLRQYRQVGDFWITRDALHFFHKNCRTCDCSPSDHYSIDYQLEYNECSRQVSNSDKEMAQMVDDLCQTSADFGYFLVRATDTSQNDLFLAGIERMIKEEGDICKNKSPCPLNLNLFECLEELKIKYEEMREKLLAKKEEIHLSKIYDRIENVSKNKMIKTQISAAKEWHKFMIKHYEDEASV